jgi:uncharacterized membrane protein
MTHPPERLDRLVENYLAAVADACTGLPAGRRADLLADLREHIAVARAELSEPSEAAIRTILDRLGEPDEIAAEARVGQPAAAAADAVPATGPVGTVTARPRSVRISPAVAMVVLGFVLIVIMLLGGTVLTMQTAAPPPVPRPAGQVDPARPAR